MAVRLRLALPPFVFHQPFGLDALGRPRPRRAEVLGGLRPYELSRSDVVTGRLAAVPETWAIRSRMRAADS